MPKACFICGKSAVMGHKITRRGMAKAKGGAGQKITGIAIRRFIPNLQRVKATISGTTKRIYACTKCLKAGLVIKKA